MTALRPCLAVVVAILATGAPLFAQESWTGKRVILKRPGIKIGYSDDDGKQIYTAELKEMSYTVQKEAGGFLKVSHRGAAGWFPKTEALLPDQAVVHFTELSRLSNPKESVPFAFLGMAHRERKQYDLALAAYTSAIAREARADWFLNRGLIHMDMKNTSQAIADYTEAIKKDPKFVTAFENRAHAYTEAGKTLQALDDWNSALALEPKNAQALLRRAKIYLGEKDYDRAIADLTQSLKIDPDSAGVFQERGQIYADLGKTDLALADLTRCLELQKDNIEVLLTRSQLYADKKQFAAALGDAEQVLKLVPTSVEGFVARGWNRFVTGKFEDAIADLTKARELNPKNAAAYNAQAWMWATCPDEKFRDGKKALEFAKKAVELSGGKDPDILDTQAAALAELGRFDEAVKLQEQVVRDVGDTGDLATAVRARLERYQKNEPYRQKIYE